jgi:RNA recognition motif-containing protein
MGTRLYVGNLPFTADETQIRDLFAQSGRTVSEVKLVTDRDTGRPRGFGFVEMGSSEDADGAIRDLNGRDFGGRALTVNEAKERSAGGGGGGFGGGYGGGGGGNAATSLHVSSICHGTASAVPVSFWLLWRP